MSHPRWPGFDTKTGNPFFDNHSRRLNQRLYRECKKKLKFHAVGRKRRKQLKRVEGGKYIILWAAAMNDLVQQRAQAKN